MRRYFDSVLARFGLGSRPLPSEEGPEPDWARSTARLSTAPPRAYTSGHPLIEGLSLKEAVKQAHAWSSDMTTETAVAHRAGDQPRPEAPGWAVVLVHDYDAKAWRTDDRVRFNNGHSHPDCPWQLHNQSTDNPYQG